MPKTDEEAIVLDDAAMFDAIQKDEDIPQPKAEEQSQEPEEEEAAPDEAEDGDEPEAAEQGEAESDKPKRKDYRVPAWRLREEAEARRAAEDRIAQAEAERQRLAAEREAERRELEEMRRRIAAMQAPKLPDPPDMLENPQGYRDYMRDQSARQLQAMKVDITFDFVNEQDPDGFKEAFANFQREIQTGNSILKDRVIHASNPGLELMRWHKQTKALSEIGTDPEAYKQKVRDELRTSLMADPEFRSEILKAMKGEASAPAGNSQSRPNTVTRLPSLNRATGSGSNEASDNTPMSDAELFRHVAR